MDRTTLIGTAVTLVVLVALGVARRQRRERSQSQAGPRMSVYDLTAAPHPHDTPPSDAETDTADEAEDSDTDPDRPTHPELTPAGQLIDAATLDGALVRIYDHPSVPHEHGAIIDVAAGTVETQLRADVVEIDGAKHQADPTGTPLILENVSITYYPDEDRAEIEL